MQLSAQNLSCERNEQTLFDNLNFHLKGSEILQIKGLNGSGKTSLLRILCGLAPAASGSILWNQQNIQSNREDYHQDLLYIGHHLGIKAGLTPKENLHLALTIGSYKAKSSIEKALGQVALTKYANTLTQHLSAGQKRRVALAKLILISASLWILDEPFTALDTQGVALVVNLLKEQMAAGGNVIITSHQAIPISDVNIRELQLS